MTIYNAKDFGRVIRARRKEKGLTQERLSLYTNCSTRYISELERGKETAELGKALLICNTLGMNLTAAARNTRLVR